MPYSISQSFSALLQMGVYSALDLCCLRAQTILSLIAFGVNTLLLKDCLSSIWLLYLCNAGYCSAHTFQSSAKRSCIYESILPMAMSATVNLPRMMNSFSRTQRLAFLSPLSTFVLWRSIHSLLGCSRCCSKKTNTAASQMPSARTSTCFARISLSFTCGYRGRCWGGGYSYSIHSRMSWDPKTEVPLCLIRIGSFRSGLYCDV